MQSLAPNPLYRTAIRTLVTGQASYEEYCFQNLSLFTISLNFICHFRTIHLIVIFDTETGLSVLFLLPPRDGAILPFHAYIYSRLRESHLVCLFRFNSHWQK